MVIICTESKKKYKQGVLVLEDRSTLMWSTVKAAICLEVCWGLDFFDAVVEAVVFLDPALDNLALPMI